jgi:hypothetical protein
MRSDRQKTTTVRQRKKSNHTLFADNSIFRPRIKNGEINQLRKQNKIIEEPL